MRVQLQSYYQWRKQVVLNLSCLWGHSHLLLIFQSSYAYIFDQMFVTIIAIEVLQWLTICRAAYTFTMLCGRFHI